MSTQASKQSPADTWSPRLPRFTLPQVPQRYARLLSPFEIGKVRLRNRIAISAHFAGWFVEDGLPSQRYADYIEHRAAGGVGLFCVGGTTPQWAGGPDWIINDSDAIVPRYAMLAEAAHRHDTKIFAQLLYVHDHRQQKTPARIRVGMHAQAALPSRWRPWTPDRSVAELKQLAADCGAAAKRAVEGSMDGLELHAHEGFLFAQFLSKLTNRRTDEYGGSLENRLRLTTDCLAAMRDAVGSDVPLGLRIKADDCEEGGVTASEYLEVVAMLQDGGLIDYLSITAGDGGLHHGPMARPEGEWLPLVDRIRKQTSLPIMHAGRIVTPQMAEQALADDAMDVVCLTKAHIADGHFTKKLYEDRPADIRLCTRCLQQCIGSMEQMSCVYNPVTSRERVWGQIEPATQKKRVLVVGGGPAGMEAAIVASKRGHDVTVWERAGRIGGQIWIAASAPLRREWSRIAEFYQRQAERGDFDVVFGKTATIENVEAFAADEVVVATGSKPVAGQVSGAKCVVTPTQVLAGELDEARRVVIDNTTGEIHGLLAADYLSERGAAVVYLDPDWAARWRTEGMTREEMMNRLRDRGVDFRQDTSLFAMRGGSVVLRSRWSAAEELVTDVDAIVQQLPAEPVNQLATDLAERGIACRVIGDACKPAGVYDATLQANLVARDI